MVSTNDAAKARLRASVSGPPLLAEGEQGLTRRDEIVDAAAVLFETRGYHDTPVQAIADAVGLSKATLYYHIGDKEELLYEIHDRFIRYVLQRAAEWPSDASPVDRVRWVVRDILDVIRLYRPHVTVFFRERHTLSGERGERIAGQRRRYESIIRQVILDGQASGHFAPDLDARVLTLAILGMANWTYQWMRPNGRLSVEEIADQFLRVLLDGMLARLP